MTNKNLRFMVAPARTVVLSSLLLLPWGTDASASADRLLSFLHTHTGQSITVTYYRDGAYVPEALEELNRFLFDFRTGDVVDMDPTLFDILHSLQKATGSTGAFEVISAYRSPETNEMLRRRSSGVAKRSQHLLGKAIDVRLTDVDTHTLRDVALSMKLGGVGYYPRSNFIHLDTGRVRRW